MGTPARAGSSGGLVPGSAPLRRIGHDGLKQVREAVEKAFSSFVVEKKAYAPHVTLAKIKKQKWLALPEKPALKERWHLIEMVDTVCVFESLSLDGKRRYEPIDTFPLL